MRAVMLRTARHYSSNAARALASSHAPSSSSSVLPRLGHHRSAPADFVSWLPSGGGNFLVTYNINNGVQILTEGNFGRAVPLHPPPSYNEAVLAGPPGPAPALQRDNVGPPPPYASRESLVGVGVRQPRQPAARHALGTVHVPEAEPANEPSAESPLLPGTRRARPHERPSSVLLEAKDENDDEDRRSSWSQDFT